MGVMGNKAAGEAKLAADTGDCGAEQPDCGGNSAGGVGMELIRLAFTAKRDMRTRFKARRAKQWVDDQKTAKPTSRLVELPYKKVLKLYEGSLKPYASILI